MASSLTEEQKDFIRKEAFMMERSREDTIDEAAWQLGEHPLVIGGGSIRIGVGGESFIKGDVRKIYAEHGITYDGTRRFGLPPYKQRYSPPIDWIARARVQTRSGTNSQGNRYNTPGGTNSAVGSSYHYSNSDGSYYYKNDDGSTYRNNGKGGSTYTAPSASSTRSRQRPKLGDLVELMGLSAKPELNGCKGIIIENWNKYSGRCGVRLDDGTGVNVKPENIRILSPDNSPDNMLADALAKLEAAGGKQWKREILTPMILPGEDYEDGDDAGPPLKKPHQYLKELLKVGDVRYQLGQYDQAGSIYFRAYYATMNAPGSAINDPSTFPVAHKMIQAWLKLDEEELLNMAHGMAEQSAVMPGCPSYILQDMKDAATAMRMKGMEVTSIMDAFKNMGIRY
jgi:hypothetical protein